MEKRKSGKFPFRKSKISSLLNWAMVHDYFSFLNGNSYTPPYGAFPNILFAGKKDMVNSSLNGSFDQLEQFIRHNPDWIYGYFTYDLKNETEALSSDNPSTISFDDLGFIIPETVIHIQDDYLQIESFEDPGHINNNIESFVNEIVTDTPQILSLKSATTKKQYIENVKSIKNSIVEGEFYELNYCIEYTCQANAFDPVRCYQKLNDISPMPFSGFMKLNDKYLICASPERFLKKEGDKIISQPIKGTIKRSFDKSEDESLKEQLLNSEKERAENLMIVDLVRNDLAKSSITGSVKVDELFGIYTFKKIHQMISTVSSTHDKKISTTDIIKNAFPMGSMTGAPKIRVMDEIEKLEDTRRGLYSGAMGYFTPNQNFDFNVVIRSIIFDEITGKISFHVGSAITNDSDPEYEFNECMLKAESIFEVLSS